MEQEMNDILDEIKLDRLHVDVPDDLTDEDEAALDRAWDSLTDEDLDDDLDE